MILCYYHDDLDGICSAAIINKVFGDVRCIPVQYNKDTWDIQDVVDSDEVYVVDFTFPDMEKLAEIAGEKLHWIDHHKTAYEQHKILWNDHKVYGYRNLDNSGCGLTWKYCYNEPMPLAVVYIEDRDLWKFQYDKTKSFCAGANAIIEDAYHQDWKALLSSEFDEIILGYVFVGDAILKSQSNRIEKLFDSGYPFEFHGYNALAVNSTSDISELGEYIYTNGYELALIWQVKGDKLIVSLRSNTVDCSEIAKKYGGGGHPGAAGFSIENNGFPMGLL